ncbi:X-ray radiation resistance-associated protein 1-like isoform X2 [Tubulanus polymorphus]|uniref:X-ray radiation resistance-associated protein 1-like isoform X2 n=1 Tax=Tubulanus polymorphus TaxID=672921 RepID=UPI003DA42A72
MAAKPGMAGIKYDDGSATFAINCFPVRTILKQSEEGEGAWLVEQRTEQRRRFKAVLCTKPPKTYSQIREERKRAERREKQTQDDDDDNEEDDDGEEANVLDGFFLMKHTCVQDPSDLCSVNIVGKELSEYKEEDLALFDNVAYVNAAENYLPLEAFRGFPIIRELEMPMNGLRGIKLQLTDFQHLEILDLSYNNLSKDDILPLGLLPVLKVLHLTGNGFSSLPPELAKPLYFMDKNEEFQRIPRFPMLEIFMLDDNRLSDYTTFAALAGLKKLKVLNLQKNEIHSVPHLKVTECDHVTEASTNGDKRSKRSRAPSSPVKESTNTTDPDNQIAPQPSAEDVTVAKSLADVRPGELDSERKTDRDGVNTETGTSVISARLNKMIGDVREPSFPPFPELRSVDLSFNKIEHEEGLLATAGWPMLSELVIHDNPLTTRNSGEPPLLKRFLQQRLGIEVVRKRIEYGKKPQIEIADDPVRKVKTIVPKVPKVPVDVLLALEAAPRTPPGTAPSTGHERERQSTPPKSSTPLQTREANEEERHETNKEETLAGDPFFMTQPADQEAEKSEEPRQQQRVPVPPAVAKDTRKKHRRRKGVETRYKGYEDLLDVDADDEDDTVLPKDMQGSVRALQYTLNHPLMFRDPVQDLHIPQPPYQKYNKKMVMPPAPENKTKSERVKAVLREVEERQTIVEAPLPVVLKQRKKYTKDFPEADKLLQQIQKKYNDVRFDSLADAEEVRSLIHNTISDVRKNAQKLELHA